MSENITLARQFMGQVLALLKELTASVTRGLELQQSNGLNWLAAGTVTGGSTIQNAGVAVKLLDPNPHRRGLIVQNLSAAGGASITVGLGQTQPIPGQGLVLAPGQLWNGTLSNVLWRGSVYVVGAAGAAFSYVQASGPTRDQRPI